MSKSQIVITLDPAVWGRAPEYVRSAFYTIWEDGPEDCGTHLRFYHPGLSWNMLDLPGSRIIRDWVFELDKEDYGYLELGPKYDDVYAFGSIHEQGYRLRSTILFPDGTELPKEAA
jgi:hypothetical protein